MKKFQHSRKAHVIAVIVCVVSLLAILLNAVGIGVLAAGSAYSDGGAALRTLLLQSVLQMDMSRIYDYAEAVITNDEDALINYKYAESFKRENTNLSFTVIDEDGAVVLNNFAVEDYQAAFNNEMSYWIDNTDNREQPYDVTQLSVRAVIPVQLTVHDLYYHALNLADFLVSMRYALIVFTVLGVAGFFVSLGFLFWMSGHKEGVEGICLNFFDRIPFDLYLAGAIFLGSLAIAITDEIYEMVIFILCVIFLTALVIAALFSFVVRVKAGGWWRNTLIWRVLRLLGRGCAALAGVLFKIPLWWQAGLLFVGISFIEFLGFLMGFEDILILWLIERPLLLAAIVYFVLMLRRLEKAGQEIAKGNVSYRADMRWMLPTLKRHGENLCSISEGLTAAVSEQMRSERMKAELITNVSHDIKTPLTSIVNYVDLLKTAGLDSPDAPEYLAVLERQSARLKKLTEDLVEASKASTGCIPVNAEDTDVNVLLSQAVGEYEEKLLAAGLEPMMRLTERAPVICADGRLLWRVFDNLLGNIVKYAQRGTRVYITSNVTTSNVTTSNVTTSNISGEKVTISFRNISRDVLNISGDELTERFVRGDASRNTEGSGLGLSIARSLVELQGGRFDISIDGDLFKVTMDFNAISVQS
ncbi:MAG: sensor histidine kinase [Clostridia bacterium]|nr:sensor histidine kinase [Clostridia bacterium]